MRQGGGRESHRIDMVVALMLLGFDGWLDDVWDRCINLLAGQHWHAFRLLYAQPGPFRTAARAAMFDRLNAPPLMPIIEQWRPVLMHTQRVYRRCI